MTIPLMAGAAGGTSSSVGGPAESINFPGSDDYLYVTDATWGSYDRSLFSVAMSIYPDTLKTAGLFCKENRTGFTDREIRIYMLSDGRIGFIGYDSSNSAEGSFTTTATVSSGQWNSILLHWDSDNAASGDRMKIWINGTEDLTSFTEPSADVRTSTEEVQVGHYYNSNEFQGEIHQMTFASGYLMTPEEVFAGDGTAMQDLSGVTGLKSLLDVAGSVVTSDTALGSSWTQVGTLTADSNVPT